MHTIDKGTAQLPLIRRAYRANTQRTSVHLSLDERIVISFETGSETLTTTKDYLRPSWQHWFGGNRLISIGPLKLGLTAQTVFTYIQDLSGRTDWNKRQTFNLNNQAFLKL